MRVAWREGCLGEECIGKHVRNSAPYALTLSTLLAKSTYSVSAKGAERENRCSEPLAITMRRGLTGDCVLVNAKGATAS